MGNFHVSRHPEHFVLQASAKERELPGRAAVRPLSVANTDIWHPFRLQVAKQGGGPEQTQQFLFPFIQTRSTHLIWYWTLRVEGS